MADFDMLRSLVASSVKEVKEEFFGRVNTTELVTYFEDILPLNPNELSRSSRIGFLRGLNIKINKKPKRIENSQLLRKT